MTDIKIEGMFIHETDKAILFVPEGNYDSNLQYNDEDAVWLPKFKKNGDLLIDYEDTEYEKNDPITLYIPEWLAIDKGLE